MIARYPNITSVLSKGFNGIAPLKFAFCLLKFSTIRNTTVIRKHTLQINVILVKNRIEGYSLIDLSMNCNSNLRYHPFFPANIGTNEKFSNASSVTVPSAFLVIRSMR